MLKRISRRVVPLIGAVALLLNLAVVPQRARAVAVTATVVAASAAAILTACGVSYWAATQTDAIDYIAGKIDDYLDSIDETGTTYEDWLEISGTSQLFEVVSGGVMRFGSGVANKLLDFCRWLQQAEGIESGGDVVGNGSIAQILQYSSGGYTGSAQYINDGTHVILSFDTFLQSTTSSKKLNVLIPVDNTNNQITVTITDIVGARYVGSWNVQSSNGDDLSSYSGFGLSLNLNTSRTIAVSDDYIILGVTINNYDPIINGTVYFTVSSAELSKPSTATITPSDFVNVPAAIDSDAVFAVKPSVDLASGDSVDDAADALLDGITSQDGLSSAVEDTPNTSWGWLYTLLSNIAGTIGAGVSDIKDKLDGIKGSADDAAEAAQGASTAAQGAASAAQDAATAAQGVETAVEGLQSTAEGIEDNTATIARNLAPATYGDVADYQLDLTSLFPFCIPRDIYTAIGLLVAEPEAPSIDWDMPLPNGSTYHIEYDLSDWDGIASLLRHLELLLYGVGLMMATKSIIKW